MNNISISVCMATYNGEKFIKQQINSILGQLNYNDQIIISDDNSTDSTIEIIKQLNDDRIVIYYNIYERGYTSNFQNSLRYAKGDYIFLADQDDIWLPNRISRIMKLLTHSLLVVSNAEIVDANLSSTNQTLFQLTGGSTTLLANLIRFRHLGCCLAFHKRLLSIALPFPNNHRLCTHDYWIMMCAIASGVIASESHPLLLYRRHQSNSSSGGLASYNNLLFKALIRIYVIYNLLLRKISRIIY